MRGNATSVVDFIVKQLRYLSLSLVFFLCTMLSYSLPMHSFLSHDTVVCKFPWYLEVPTRSPNFGLPSRGTLRSYIFEEGGRCVSCECSLMHSRLHTVPLVRLPGLLPSRRSVSASAARGSWQSSSSGSGE